MMRLRDCPECGAEDSVHMNTIPDYQLGVVETSGHCSKCGYGKVLNARKIDSTDKKSCRVCGDKYMPESLSQKFCKDCEENKTVVSTYDGGNRFGFVIPQDTGVVWRHQGGGMTCKSFYVEGVNIPIEVRNKKSGYDSDKREWEENRDLLSELRKASYIGDYDKLDEVWKELKNHLQIDWREVDAPSGENSNAEAFQWVEITDVIYDRNGHGWRSRFMPDLVGETVLMYYPNKD